MKIRQNRNNDEDDDETKIFKDNDYRKSIIIINTND